MLLFSLFQALAVVVLTLPPPQGPAEKNDLAQLAVTFGRLYREGRIQEARGTAAALVKRLDATRDRSDLDVAANLNNQASLSYAEGELDAAEPLYKRALEIYETVVGSNHPSSSSVRYNLAGLYIQQGRDEAAQSLYEHILGFGAQPEGRHRQNPAEVLNNLGVLFLKQQKFKQAETLLAEAHSIWVKEIGPDSPQAAIAISNLALLQAQQGDFAEATALYSKALEVEESVFGPQHPELATTLNNLGALYRLHRKPRKAFEAHQRALSIFEPTLGLGDVLTLETVWFLGELVSRSKDLVASPADYNVFQMLVVQSPTEANTLYQSIRIGENFAAIAINHSVDESAKAGGYVRANPVNLRAEIRNQLVMLKTGGTSEPFEVNGSWFVIRKIYEPPPKKG